MAFSPDYEYQVTAYEFIKDTLGGGRADVEAPSVNVDGWAVINETTKSVTIGNQVMYEVRVYKKSNHSLVGDDDGVRVIVLDSYRNKVSSFAKISSVKQKSFVSGKGNTVFYFKVDATAKGTVLPDIRVELKLNTEVNPGTTTFGDLYATESPSAKAIPVTFTKAVVPPSIPKGLKDLVGSERARWNPCDNRWVGMLIEQKTNPSTNKLGNAITLVRCDKDGSNITKSFLGWDTLTSGPNFGKAQEELLKAVRADCGTIDDAPAASVQVTPSDGLIRYNPPSHFATRGISHGNRVTANNDSVIAGYDKKGNPIAISPVNRADFVNSRAKLGRIYQSEAGAQALNQRGGGPKGKGKQNYWGFRFTYNPNKLSYGTTTNTSIDWMLNSADPANLLGGNTTVEVELYLNRIADMSELKKINADSIAKNYPTPLIKEDIEGILARGTEYDLEFLYRVLNGDPGKTSLLTYAGETADFGYITGTPCWFHLHDNMRYFGSMSSVNVNHMIFTESMVPMLSVVTLSFIRYPSLEFSPADVKEKFYEVSKQNTASTTTTGGN